MVAEGRADVRARAGECRWFPRRLVIARREHRYANRGTGGAHRVITAIPDLLSSFAKAHGHQAGSRFLFLNHPEAVFFSCLPKCLYHSGCIPIRSRTAVRCKYKKRIFFIAARAADDDALGAIVFASIDFIVSSSRNAPVCQARECSACLSPIAQSQRYRNSLLYAPDLKNRESQ